MRRRAQRQGSLRVAVTWWIGAFGVLAVTLSVLLMGATRVMHDATAVVLRDMRSRGLVEGVELRLTTHTLLGRFGEPEGGVALDDARAQLEHSMRERLERAQELVGSEEERTLLSELDAQLERALARRRALEARDMPPAEIDAEMREPLERVRASLGALHAMNDEQVSQARARAAHVDAIAHAGGVAAGLILAIGLVVLVFGLRRLVLRPLAKLRDEISSRSGGSGLDEDGPEEIRDIAHALREMRAALEREREDRLAFLAGVAHDLRNPLSALKMAVVQARSTPEVAERMLPLADRQIELLARMIGDLLDATRIEAGDLDLHPETLDLRDVARELVELHRPSSPKHTLTLDVPAGPVLATADALRMQQVVGNLVSNAIKYSPDGGPIVVRVATTGEHALIEVSDRGIGIPRSELPKLFTPFRRTSGARSVAPGAGIGLSVARRIVEAHRGEIEVDSTIGLGSTFRVRVPLAAA